jgi:hypothetical protein
VVPAFAGTVGFRHGNVVPDGSPVP